MASDRRPALTSAMLRAYVAALHLRLDAPWPSQIRRRPAYRMQGLRLMSWSVNSARRVTSIALKSEVLMDTMHHG